MFIEVVNASQLRIFGPNIQTNYTGSTWNCANMKQST
uniref:Uncharacterized protein n=1 Tax=Arundo donax TaxID=35708 RepID=A0A0A8ZUK4_ARUDO